MRIDCIRPPVILLGMHRSGTSMLCDLLAELGLFLGASVQGDHEAVFFLGVNDRLLRNVNASWDNPAPFVEFLNHEPAVRMSTQCLRGDVLSRPIRRYLGLRRYIKYRNVAGIDQPWGWKDPRNTYTLPLWLRLFPEARIVNLVRNGIDVASSLRAREQRLLTLRIERFEHRMNRPSTRTRLQRAGYRGSARCLSLQGGFGLWEEYVTRAERVMASITNPRLTLVYEQFLADPRPRLAELTEFCQLPEPAHDRIAAAAARVDPDRGAAFLRDPELSAFYQQVRDTTWMRHYGYARMD